MAVPSSLPSPIEDTVGFLYGLRNRGSAYGIDRMQIFAEALGRPQQAFPVIHVAGTNGKGSACAMLDACLRANGLRSGLFTSPHLVRLGERIRVNGKILQDDKIVRCVEEMRLMAEEVSNGKPEMHPTFFEFIAAMGFLVFMRAKVDLAVVETGLGGRLDATNVVEPTVSVITSIGLDHCDLLGHDLATIAREKAGIVKHGKPVVLGWLPEEAEFAIREVAEERGCQVISVPERLGMNLPETSLTGSFQRRNGAVALTVCELLADTFPLDMARCRDALLEVHWPGRWQEVEIDGRTLILDATHNAEGAKALEENLRTLDKRPVILAGTLGEGRAADLMTGVARHAREIRLLVPDQPRACSYEVLEATIPDSFAGKVIRSTVADEFPRSGWPAERGNPTVVTGSIYLIGEILARLEDDVPQSPFSSLQDWH